MGAKCFTSGAIRQGKTGCSFFIFSADFNSCLIIRKLFPGSCWRPLKETKLPSSTAAFSVQTCLGERWIHTTRRFGDHGNQMPFILNKCSGGWLTAVVENTKEKITRAVSSIPEGWLWLYAEGKTVTLGELFSVPSRKWNTFRAFSTIILTLSACHWRSLEGAWLLE